MTSPTPPIRWHVYPKDGHHYWTQYEVSQSGILRAAVAISRMAAFRDVPLTLDDAAEIGFELEIQLATYEGLMAFLAGH